MNIKRIFNKQIGLLTAVIILILTIAIAQAEKMRETAVVQANTQSPIGTNLDSIVDWSDELPFLDVFKSARQWLPQCVQGSDPGCTDGSIAWDTGELNLLDLDSDGWIQSLPAPADAPIYTRASAILLSSTSAHLTGQYVVLYDGEGTITYSFGAQKNIPLSTPGRDVVDVTPQNGLSLLTIISTDPNSTGDYIRNIRVILPDQEPLAQTERFNPVFLNEIADYRAIRFMDWGNTNHTAQIDWAARPQVNDFSYAIDGVPVEVMVELVNQVQADPWFTLPHQASDDYMTQYAALVRDTLDPDLKVYVEYSNEVWNSGFPQAGWVEAQGEAEWPGGSHSGFTKRMNWYGKRTAEMCDIWKTAWGAQSDRVICAMGAQAANSWTASEPLACPLWSQAPCIDHGIGAVAIAPYLGGYLGGTGWEATVTAWTQEADGGLDSLFAELTNTALPESAGWVVAHKTVADQNGVDLIAYEGGQHLVGVGGVVDNNAITTLFIAANRDARMGTLYTTHLDDWRQGGGNLFINFTSISGYSMWGSWGVLEYTGQGSSPKYDAVMTFINDNPCWWPNCEVVTSPPPPAYSIFLPMIVSE